MIDKKQARLRRSRQTRAKIAELKAVRLSVHRSNCHIYAQVISSDGGRVLASASTLESDLRTELTSNIEAAKKVGKVIAERATNAGVNSVALDKSGFKYHGRVKALADSAREAGLKF